ncbi:cytochrome P450 714C2-like [Andrographis paniculata]|uniref:cytochrome P450 714C2-like n=1 Tax=Andrographis paniculata TaxID=175694 RepID=UPI0021E77C2F|nr:cytochrome P450 714C2-like [Andrographis paniculata]
MDQYLWAMLCSMFLVLLGFFSLRLYDDFVAMPQKLRRILLRQGINGPPPKLILGNILEIKKSRDAMDKAAIKQPHPPVIHNAASVFSFLEQWRKQYGPLYLFSLGKMQILYVSKPDLVKAITTCTSPDLGRPYHQQEEFGPLLGQGILTSNGSIWARQRKIIAPELFMDKVKGMMDIITESALTLVNSWKHEIDNGALEITVDDYMKRFSGDTISRACFGSSHSKGQEIFAKFGHLQELISSRIASLGVPGLRYLPTRNNLRIRALEKEIQGLILKVVKERQLAGSEKDLLQILLESAESSHCHSPSDSDSIHQFIVDNCRNIYLAGFETSAVAASWCVMLLASNPDWQTQIRDEINEVCHGRPIPDMNMLRKMKQLNMVIQETMRLYPSTPTLSREALEDITIGDVEVPKGVHVWTMVAALHTDTSIWGADALEFKPERFQNGIAGACNNPNAYMPFGFGRRVCVGQHLAMVELKLLMASIVGSFSFTLSPNYVHSPAMRMIVEPKYGVKIMVQKLQ